MATIITQVEVDSNDLAFKNPTKPIGVFYDYVTAQKLMEINNIVMRVDAGRGWRRVVASPVPVDILEKNLIKRLFNKHQILIFCGGGGIPVIKKANNYFAIDGVIDKDLTAAKLAHFLDADQLLILTTVSQVAINFQQWNQKNLKYLLVKDAKKYIKNNQFASGSMLPKVSAAINFVIKKQKRVTIIAHLNNAIAALNGESGTRIVNISKLEIK